MHGRFLHKHTLSLITGAGCRGYKSLHAFNLLRNTLSVISVVSCTDPRLCRASGCAETLSLTDTRPWSLQRSMMCKGLATLSTCCLERAKELRARLGSFLQKPDWNLSCCKIGKHKPTLEECLRWKESFEKLLSCKYGLCAFTSFLVSEFSEENIAFYFACEDFRNTKCLSKLPSKAKRIFEEFVCSDAPREINIDHETRDITRSNMAAPSLCCFDAAQHKIYLLMAKDCYPRFLRSPAYRDLLRQATPPANIKMLNTKTPRNQQQAEKKA